MNVEKATYSDRPTEKSESELETEQLKGMLRIQKRDQTTIALNLGRLEQTIAWAISGFEDVVSHDLIVQELLRNIFDGIDKTNIADALILAATAFVEKDPAYSHVGSRLVLKKLFKEVTKASLHDNSYESTYKKSFINAIKRGVRENIFDKRLLDFNLDKLVQALRIERDSFFGYMGIRILYERYFIKIDDLAIEMPQSFWMRVSMGICINEEHKEERAIEFYNIISQLHYVPSTPTLLHSGLVRAQLSSCFLGTVEDDLKHIFKCIGDNAQLSKWSGGVAYDWTNVRATGSLIKSIKVESQGLIPFLKISNGVTAAINRSGKRRSASCVYLETWHLDVEDFLDLRRNTGDERRRAHDINTSHWIPDLFMKRVINNEKWTLFSPNETPDLHDLYGKAFEKRYVEYEALATEGKIEKFKIVEAAKLWRKMLSRLFETGHPWITFKDPCNVRSPQDHQGVIHCSNLCTEITLNTSAQETAVCNLGSINLAHHIKNGVLDKTMLQDTTRHALRMLDNVIDINFYPTQEAKHANLQHRPVGLGLMGFQDALYILDIPFDSSKALEFAEEVQELISYYAISASAELAQERGAYQSYQGSKWDRNIFPQDTIALLEQERGIPVEVKGESRLDWSVVREQVRKYGMRNSNTMAIAPTATISNIAGCFPCIEPIYKNLYVKANMSGEFTVINHYLVADLKKLGLWSQDIVDQIKFYDGSVQSIDTIPQTIKDKYKEAFEIDPEWLIEITAVRGKWIDQSQSHNVFMKGVSGKKLNQIYMKGWRSGLKTMYYLRTLGASQIEKSTLDASKYGFTQKRDLKEPDAVNSNGAAISNRVTNDHNGATDMDIDTDNIKTDVRSCNVTEADCEVCQ